MKQSLLHESLRVAREKLDRHPELKCYPHYSFVVTDKIVEWATNISREPPRHYGYHRTAGDKYRPKFHAEIAAYTKARGLLTNDQFSIINIRLTKAGQVRLSKPCEACFMLLSSLGCRSFYYSSDVGFLKQGC